MKKAYLLFIGSMLITPIASAQQSSSCLVLAESVDKYQIDSCNPAKIQQLITAKVNNGFVMTWQVVNGNEQVMNIIYGERGNELGGNRVEKSTTSYKRTGKSITTILTPKRSPDCALTEEVVEETKTTLVLKVKAIKGSTCNSMTLGMMKDDIASGRQTKFVKINN